jgi:CRISPR-associated protein (TIGR03986 family)
MPRYYRSEERTATRRGEVITAVSSHTIKPKPPKLREYPRRFWGEDVAAWFDVAQDGDEVQVLVHVTADSEGFLSLRDQPVLAPVPTPGGATAAADAAGGFVNPYTFVPTLPREGLIGGPGETGLGDSGQAGPPSHALVSAGEWTGTVRVRLTTLTPLLLPDTERAGTDDDGRQTFHTRLDPAGQPLLPGSSLKGALRSAYETITASRFGVLTDHQGRLAYRIPATQGIDVVPAVVEDDGHGRRVFRLCRGDRDWSAPGRRGNEVQLAAWVPAYGAQERHLHLVGGLSGRLRNLHGRLVGARLRLYQYDHPKRPGRFQVWRVTHLAPDLASLDVALTATPPNDPATPSRSLSLVDSVPPRTALGRLSVTGHSIGTKHDERFFACTDDDRQVPVEAAHEEFWQAVLDAYTAAKDYNTVPDGLERSRHVTNAPILRDLPPRTPVYVTLDGARTDGARTDGARTDGARTDDARTTVTGVHPVMIGRMPFDRSPLAVLDASLQPAATGGQLSPADRLFGWVPVRPTRDRQRGSSGYRGRLAVRSVTCTDDDWQANLPDGGVVLAPLSGPKPTQFRFYAARDQTGSPVPPKAAKDSGYTADAGLRGRKAYRWPAVPDTYWEPPGTTGNSTAGNSTTVQNSTTGISATVPGTQRHREYLDPGAPATQTVRYRNWVRPGVTFVADLFLDGVPTAELGALLWLLDRADTSPLRLGAGKPHGFGVLACTIDPSGTRVWNSDAVTQGWRQLARPAPADPGTLRSLATDFESNASRHPVLAEALASYRAVTAGIPAYPVHYPRTSPEPRAESYEWFVANDRTPREGVMHGWALPHARDQEQRLPYLTGDRDRGGAPPQGQRPASRPEHRPGPSPRQGPRPGPGGNGRRSGGGRSGR